MIELHTNNLKSLTDTLTDVGITRITTNPNYVKPLRPKATFLSRAGAGNLPGGFAAYLIQPPAAPPIRDQKNVLQIGPELDYLQEGDIIKLQPRQKTLRVLYRSTSKHNVFLLTERCNNHCIMCVQPPRDLDDGYLVQDILDTIPLIAGCPTEIALTGGEPTLLGERLINLLRTLKNYLPKTAVHMLTNGCNFRDRELAKAVAEVKHPDLMLGIPIYSDLTEEHDFIVQRKGAFAEAIQGILNLKSLGLRIELRIVILHQNQQHLKDMAQFIRRNLTFCDHVALMGMEVEGFAKSNLDDVWVDPYDYRAELAEAVDMLDSAKMNVSIYNVPLCLLAEKSRQFSCQSISDWKNEYVEACQVCTKRSDCCGFFATSRRRLSDHITPFMKSP